MADTRLIQRRYRLLDLIGRGGMGEVWRAQDEYLGRHVAVKRLNPMAAERGEGYAKVLGDRFRREARVAASLQHHGITVVHDFGEHEGHLYLVMELLDGRDLGRLLEDLGRPLPVPDVLDIARQVSDALAYTHKQGVVHRDLKPANIVRLYDGTVKICDFGIARLGREVATERATEPGVAMGTPHYMSPEQIEGGDVDERSDLYSLGCVLYELATGAPPFDFEDAWAVLIGHRDTAPEPPSARRPDLPAYFDAVVLDLLAKDPEDRPQRAADLWGRFGTPSLYLAPPGSEPAGDPALPAWARTMAPGPAPQDPRAVRTQVMEPSDGLTVQWVRGGDGGPEPLHPTLVDGGPRAAAEESRSAAMHAQGVQLGALGRWEEAHDVLREVTAERERLLGLDHPETLASRYETGFALSRMGRPVEALYEFEQVAEGRARTLGPDDAETLAARQETAFVLGRLGRHEEAHEVYVSVLASRERTAGQDAPDTLRCRHNLAFNLSRLGRLDESHRVMSEVAAARARVLGAGHPDTLVSRHEVAYVLGRLGRWEEALSLYGEVAVARARCPALGPDHPDTLATRYEIAICLGRLGRSEEALRGFRALAEDQERLGGPADRGTLRARHGIGVSLGRLGRWDEALAEARDVAAVRTRELGPDHPDTLVSRCEIAVALGWLGRWPDALAEYRQVAEARERVLGSDHPLTVSAREGEAHCERRLVRPAQSP